MENTNLGLEKISQEQSVCLEDFRRVVTEAYVAGYNAALRELQIKPETQPSLTEQELYYSNQRLLRLQPHTKCLGHQGRS